MKDFPSVNTRVEYRRANLVYEDVLHGSADVGLVAFPVKNKELTIIPFATDELIVAMNPQNPLSKKKSLKIEELEGVDFIAFEKDIPTRKATDEILKKAGIDVSIVMEFDNVETVKRGLEINAGVAIIPKNTVSNETDRKQLITARLDNGVHLRPLSIVHKKTRMLTPALRSFIETMKTSIKD
jgi:DNA-binding transcriptional LysR family regulator